MFSDMSVKDAVEYSTPVWVKVIGWCLYVRYSNEDSCHVVIDALGQHRNIHQFSLIAPPKPLKVASFMDDDGEEIKVTYGEYDTDRGREFIFGIDTKQETVSFAIKNIRPLIDAIHAIR